MMTFKQYLREEEEGADQQHDSVEAAAREYLKHCTQFPDIGNPLYRISGNYWDGPLNHPLRTRVPRKRLTASKGGSGREQEFLFSQPAWQTYPPRIDSIFCSTTKDFEIGEPDDDGGNLLMIYPFDGVKIAVLPDSDLNTLNILTGTSMDKETFKTIDELFSFIRGVGAFFKNTSMEEKIAELSTASDKHRAMQYSKIVKDVFIKNGKFDSEANGDDEIADKFAETTRENSYLTRLIKFVALEFPEALTPQKMGAKLVTSKGLDLPGKTREVWFSGKYLSVPARHFEEFKRAVEELS